MELADTNIQISLIEPGPITSKFRENAKLAFINNIHIEQSAHSDNYQAQLNRLESQTAPQKFTLGPEAVLKKLLHAMNAKKAKPRYYVTFPTYFMGVMRRILSTRLLDRILIKNR
jgi:short-subunit dehydrogenase